MRVECGQNGQTDFFTVSFSISGAFARRGSREGEMATGLLPAQAQVSQNFFLHLPSWFRGREHTEAVVEPRKGPEGLVG